MLAGYLPFDDDPANPEGDNINLLYKYIVSTPLTFPEYVTPHARDLLKRILVPDPRKRADLFEVARHSWLSDYAHVVSFITSTPTATTEAQKAAGINRKLFLLLPRILSNPAIEEPMEAPTLARSASVREPGKSHTAVTPVGGLTAKREAINQTGQSEKPKTSRDNKRRTVQVEYVAPQSQTTRGEASPPAAPVGSSKARVKEQGPVEVPPVDGSQSANNSRQPRAPAPASGMVSASRPTREPQRSISDYAVFSTMPATSANRPSTGGTLGGPRMPSRGNSYYGQPAAATVAQTNVEGRFSQPKGKQYSISGPISQPDSSQMGDISIGQPSTQRVSAIQAEAQGSGNKGGHRRSNTVSETLGRVTSMFSSRQPSYNDGTSQSPNSTSNKIQKSYPPTSMPGPMANDELPRQSTESRRTSFGFSRKNTDKSDNTGKSNRRFSLLPSSLSKTFSSNHRDSAPAQNNSHSQTAPDRRVSAAAAPASRSRGNSRPGMAFGRGVSRSPSQSTNGSNAQAPGFYDGQMDSRSGRVGGAGPSSAPSNQTQFDYTQPPVGDEKFPGPREPHPASHAHAPSGSGYIAPDRPYRHANDSEGSQPAAHNSYTQQQPQARYPQGFNQDMSAEKKDRPGVLQKSRKFADAYEENGATSKNHSGSSGSSKRVMDFFRRMGKQREKER
jgi:protein-serine/threonine kinase